MAIELKERLQKIDDKKYLLDVRGFACPYPQLLLAKALKEVEKGSIIETLTDNPPSLDTLPRSIKNNKQEYVATEEVGPGVWKIIARKISS